MKVPVHILGVGERKQGVKVETGRPYDFYEVSICYTDRTRFEGHCGEIVCIPSQMMIPAVVPGADISMDLSRFRFRTFVNAVYEQ